MPRKKTTTKKTATKKRSRSKKTEVKTEKQATHDMSSKLGITLRQAANYEGAKILKDALLKGPIKIADIRKQTGWEGTKIRLYGRRIAKHLGKSFVQTDRGTWELQ